MSADCELSPLATEVRRQLRGRLQGFQIDHVPGGIVLVGSAPSFYVKQLALQAVKRATALPIVRNEIEVT